MKLKYHLDRETDGIVILEADPQFRVILSYSSVELHRTTRLPMPYLYFVVRYRKDYDSQKLVYPGIYGSGLHVYGSNCSVTSIKDHVFLLPTDKTRIGLVCTDHGYDGEQFADLESLVNWVVSHWYSLLHYFEYDPSFEKEWKKSTLEDLKKFRWLENGCFYRHLMTKKDYGKPTDISLSKDTSFIDLDWPSPLVVNWDELVVENE